MTQLILAEELVRMGAVKSNLNNFILNGVLYSPGISFSQRVQIAAEKMYQEYQEQGIKCLLVKDGIVLTLWLSQPFQAVKDIVPTDQFPAKTQFQEVSTAYENETHIESNSVSSTQSQSTPTEKIMTYRGNIYQVSSNGQTSPDVTTQDKPEALKKRIYRGLKY
jgi:Golgi nucleoside diphosphatase